ncbi:hypothetical protein [Roseivirga sp. E12]|uniref:hypothetical protein n=1 Tax=Roseivirga sp. E12 TaxID=2819237 RepID=UPI001ABCE62F|nr:hypothetical protein [Roseivirga sp. E12]MBO3700369.1 hypothetical protein [Roseivirga sp. E12]
MNSTSELAYAFDFTIERHSLFNEILDWMDSNTFRSDQSYIWQIGISSESTLKSVQSKVLGDLECKHFRHWKANSFKKAIGILSRLNKHSSVFKSDLSSYREKGHHIFIYKTSCVTKRLFYHTLHQ